MAIESPSAIEGDARQEQAVRSRPLLPSMQRETAGRVSTVVPGFPPRPCTGSMDRNRTGYVI